MQKCMIWRVLAHGTFVMTAVFLASCCAGIVGGFCMDIAILRVYCVYVSRPREHAWVGLAACCEVLSGTF